MKKILLGLLICFSLVSVSTVFAGAEANTNPPTGASANNNPPSSPTTQTQNKTLPKIDNPLNASSIQDVIFLAVDIAIYVGTAFAILSLIFVGFKFVEAQGSDDKLKDAKKWFFYIIIGFAILISAKVIVEIVKNTLINTGVVNERVWNPK
jgi:hypothetical protein